MTSEESSSAPWLAAAAVLERLPDSIDTPQTDGVSPTTDTTSAAKTLSTRGSFVVSKSTIDVEVSIISYMDATKLKLTTPNSDATALLSATDAEALAEQLHTAAAEYSTADVGGESWPDDR